MSTEMWLNIIVYLIGSVQVIIQQAIVLQIAKEYHPFNKLLVSVVLLMVVYSFIINYLHIYSVLLIILWILMIILSYRFIFKQTIWVSIIMGIGQIILANVIEYIGQLLMVFVGGVIQEYGNPGQIILRTFGLGLLVLTYLVAQKVNIKLLYLDQKKESRNFWIIYLLFLYLFSFPNILVIEKNQLALSRIESYNLILFIIFFAYNIIYVRGLMKMADISQQLKVQQLYGETLETSINELRGFKHDFADILSPIVGYIDSEDWDALKGVSQKLMKQFLKINTADVVNTQLKECPPLYILVLTQLHRAEAINVDFRVSIQSDIHLKYCDPLDFSRIMGNLLDNALDAAATAGEPKFVELEIINRRGQHWITIQNSYGGDVEQKMIFQNGYTTKKNHTGLGLDQVMKIIDSYRKRGYAMELRTSCDERVFTQIFVV